MSAEGNRSGLGRGAATQGAAGTANTKRTRIKGARNGPNDFVLCIIERIDRIEEGQGCSGGQPQQQALIQANVCTGVASKGNICNGEGVRSHIAACIPLTHSFVVQMVLERTPVQPVAPQLFFGDHFNINRLQDEVAHLGA